VLPSLHGFFVTAMRMYGNEFGFDGDEVMSSGDVVLSEMPLSQAAAVPANNEELAGGGDTTRIAHN
jgi:hypothetical protein